MYLWIGKAKSLHKKTTTFAKPNAMVFIDETAIFQLAQNRVIIYAMLLLLCDRHWCRCCRCRCRRRRPAKPHHTYTTHWYTFWSKLNEYSFSVVHRTQNTSSSLQWVPSANSNHNRNISMWRCQKQPTYPLDTHMHERDALTPDEETKKVPRSINRRATEQPAYTQPNSS